MNIAIAIFIFCFICTTREKPANMIKDEYNYYASSILKIGIHQYFFSQSYNKLFRNKLLDVLSHRAYKYRAGLW
jgi:hypothetical protein